MQGSVHFMRQALLRGPHLDPDVRWKPSLKDFEHYLASMWIEHNCTVVWIFFSIGMKTDLFQACGQCWVFQICWHIECSTFTASSFRIWKSSTGISSAPLALFLLMMHSKAPLTSHSRMSGSRSVITPSWLSGSWRPSFVQFFCVFLPPLLNIFCFC